MGIKIGEKACFDWEYYQDDNSIPKSPVLARKKPAAFVGPIINYPRGMRTLSGRGGGDRRPASEFGGIV
jgi:hypothetical protein